MGCFSISQPGDDDGDGNGDHDSDDGDGIGEGDGQIPMTECLLSMSQPYSSTSCRSRLPAQ